MKNIRPNAFITSLTILLALATGTYAQVSEADSAGHSEKRVHFGYNYSKPASEVSAAVDIMGTEAFASSSALNPEESLYGRLPGLIVLQNGGFAGDRNPTMYIRGKSTFRNSSVLVLVDGIERDLSTLVNEEIESISVLKDAAALALYGMRGANGVILVTTKEGNYNDYRVNISYDRSINTAFRIPEFLNGYNYALAVNEASILDGNPMVYSKAELDAYQSGTSPFHPNVNWFDEAFKDFGSTNNFNANFQGGGVASRYFIMMNYQNEDGLFDGQVNDDERYSSDLKYDRFNLRTNLDLDLTSTTSLKLNIAGEIVNTQRPFASVNKIMTALYSVPSGVFPVRTINDVWGGTDYYSNNPVALINGTGEYRVHQTNLSTNASLVQDLGMFIEGLSAEVTFAYDHNPTFFESKNKEFLYESINVSLDPETGAILDTSTVQYGSEADLNTSNGLSWQRRESAGWAKLNYTTKLGDGILFSSLLYNMDKKVYKGQYNTYLNQNLSALASYSLLEKYFFDFSLTYGGNSLLPEGSRFGLFPAVSAAWLLTNEPFLTDNNAISSLKLRASWGLNGNGSIPANLFDQAFYNGGPYLFTDNLANYGGIREGALATMDIRYEESNKTNVGIEIGLFEKMLLNANVFYEIRSGIRTDNENVESEILGIGNPASFLGEVQNTGLDASLVWQDNVGDFRYHFAGNFLLARNKILEMNEQYWPYDYLSRTGQRVDQQFGLQSAGFFEDDLDIANSPKQVFSQVRPGDIKYVDQNDDNIINEYDVVPIGYASEVPEMYFSASLGFEFKGFGAEVLLQGISGQTDYLNTSSLFWPLRDQTTISTIYASRWTPETASTAKLPRLSLLDNANNYRKNDIWLTDASYLKVRYVEVFYNFPESVLSKMSSTSMKVYLRGSNLYSFDNIGVVDPESTGITYPTLMSFHAGIRVGF